MSKSVQISSADLKNKKIKLKELIKSKKIHSENVSQYIPLEVQHVEQLEQEIALQHEEVIEIQQNLKVQEIQQYNGQLLGFQEFSAPRYKQKVLERTGDVNLTNSLYLLLQQELFANLPQAIKYVSPDAAEQLAFNLPQLVALNKDNLPHGFLLKQTAEDELVLDYDAFLENEQANSFTPVVESDLEYETSHMVELKEQDVRHWIGNEELFAILCPNAPYSTPKQLLNLWETHGDEGVTSFFKALEVATRARPQLASFLLQNYLTHLPQWEHLHDNQAFLGDKTIEQIREELDQRAALERSVSEELYNVLGYLLSQIDKMQDEQFIKGKAAFLRESWSQFSSETENQFRESRPDAGYNKDVFIEQILASFNQMREAAVHTPVATITLSAVKQAIEQKHLAVASYNPYKADVRWQIVPLQLILLIIFCTFLLKKTSQ